MRKINPKYNILKGEIPEVGNPVHIKKIQDHERYEKEFYEWGIEIGHKNLSCSGRLFMYFECAECGHPDVAIEIFLSSISSEKLDLTEETSEGKCHLCATEYIYEDGLIKVIENPLHPEKLEREEEA